MAKDGAPVGLRLAQGVLERMRVMIFVCSRYVYNEANASTHAGPFQSTKPRA